MLSRKGIKTYQSMLPGNNDGNAFDSRKTVYTTPGLVDFNPLSYQGGSLIPKSIMKGLKTVSHAIVDEGVKVGAPIAAKYAREGVQALGKYALPAAETALEDAPEIALLAAGRKRKPKVKKGEGIAHDVMDKVLGKKKGKKHDENHPFVKAVDRALDVTDYEGSGRKPRKNLQGGAPPKALGRWVAHVKDYQAKHKCTYREALQRASASYKK